MNKFPKKLLENIKLQERLIKEMNGYDWMNMIKSKLVQIFGLDRTQAEESVYENDETGNPITASFSYRSSSASNISWNCHFVFDDNQSSYKCTTFDRDKNPVEISGVIEADIQKGINDSLSKAKNEIISKDNQLF